MKRVTVYLLLATFVLWGFAFTGDALAKVIELKYWGIWSWDPFGEIENKVIERFNKQYEGKIRVVADPLAGGEDKLAVAVAGGSPPDVIKIDRFRVGTRAGAGLLQPLDSFIKRDNFDIKEFYPPTIQEAIYQGKIYALPWETDNRPLYYNADLFAQVGLDPSEPPKTWQDVEKYCQKLDLRNPNGTWKRIGFVPHWGNWYFVGWLWAAGGDLLDKSNTKVIWDQEPGIKAAEWMQRGIERYGGWNIGFDKGYQYGAFWGGALAMEISCYLPTDAKRYAPDIEYGVGAPPRPQGLEKEPITWCGGHCLAIPTGVPKERAEAAWEFIKFYCASEWAQGLLGTVRIPPYRKAALSKEFISQHPLMRKVVGLMEYGRYRPVIPCGGELWSIYQDKFYALLSEGKMPARQIVSETARLGQIELDKGWQRAKVK